VVTSRHFLSLVSRDINVYFTIQDSHTARFLFDHLLKSPLVAHRTVLLVTHHVELVLPGTHYLVQLLDGRIHRQGTVDELKQQGLLDYIAHDPALHPQHKQEENELGAKDDKSITQQGNSDPEVKPKQARKLIEDEVRAEGRVRWLIYKTYLEAS
jgi:ABC-type multidrug transport system ATPase subunit